MHLKPKVLNKSNPTKTAAKCLWPWFSFILAVFVLLILTPITVSADSTCGTSQGNAQTCNFNDIVLKTDIKINGQTTNFVRLGQQDGSSTIEVIVTLVSPPTLTFNSTNIGTTTPPGGTPDTGKLLGFGAVLTPSNTSQICGNQSLGPIGTGLISNVCSNPNNYFDATQSNNKISGPTFQAGQPVFDYTFTIDKTNFTDLGITQLNNGTDPNSGTNQAYAYPEIDFQNLSTDFNSLTGAHAYNTYFKGGNSFYVQLYDTQANANKVTGPPLACTGTDPTTGANIPSGCVPGYGSAVGSGNNLNAGPGVTDKLMQLLNEIVAFVLASIQQLIYGIFFLLVSPVIVAVLGIHAYQDTFVAVIYSGWETIRNLCDIFFIVALIIIAMATLFRVESYKARHLLVQLIIAALLINFSLVIGQSILAVADTVQAQFLPADAASVNGLAYKLMTTNNSTLMNYLQGQQNANASAVNSSIGGLVASVFWVAMSLGSLAVFGAIAAFLVIRIVMLWLLLMISPVAYAVGVLPSTAQYREKWWKEFLKYAFFTPIMAFFLNMAALMATNATVNSQLQIAANNASIFNGQNGLSSLIVTLGSNILLLVFLIASLKVATLAGVYGAQGITDIARKGIFAPFQGAAFLAGRGVGWVNRKRQEIGSSLLEQEGEHKPGFLKKTGFLLSNPDAFFKGWQQRAEELKHQAEGTATAGGREMSERFLTRGKLKIPYRQFAERKDENALVQDYSTMRKESLMDAAADAEKLGGEEGKRRRRAIVLAAAKQGYMDDLLRKKHFADQYADDDGTFYSAEVLNRFLYGYLGDDEQAQRLMAEDLEELGKSTGHYEYLGHAYYDNDSKRFKRGMELVGDAKGVGGRTIKGGKLKNTWQTNYAVGELKKVSGRARSQIAPHNMVTLRAKLDAGGNIDAVNEIKDQMYGRTSGELDEYQRGVLSMFDGATLQQASFSQGRTKEWILSDDIDKNTGAVIVKDDLDVKRIQSLYEENPDLVRSMYAQLTNMQPIEVKGIRVVKLDAAGKTTPVAHLGDSTVTVTPVIKTVSTEVIDSKTLGLKKEETDALRGGKVIDNAIDAVYRGASSPATIEANIRSAFTTARAPVTHVTAIKDEIYKKVRDEYSEKYNPMTVISRLDEDYKLTPVEISELRKELQPLAGNAFDAATIAGRAVTRADFAAQVTGKIAAVAGRLPTGNKLSTLTPVQRAAAEKLFIDHMMPI